MATQSQNDQLTRQAAQRAIVEARQTTNLKQYGLIARQLPAQIRQHGLGHMLVFLHKRGKQRDASPHTVLKRQVENHLAETLHDRSGSLAMLTERDSRVYWLATRQVDRFLNELLLFVEKLA
jgi:CRISPR/Cas system CMR-associated protein Cmr5 small subunit